MACPKCGCKVTYEFDDAACGEVFDIDDHAEEDDDE